MKRGCVSLIAGASLVGIVLVFCWNDWRVDWHLRAARSALKSRDLDQAFAALEAATRVSPDSGEVLFWMARAYRRQGKLNDVHRYLQRAQQAGISRSRIQREEWLAMAQAGQMTDAEPHLKELFVDPGEDGPEICEAYANGYLLSYRFAQALAVVDAWQSDFPKDPQPHLLRGLLAEQNSNWTTAAEHFQKAFDLAPQRVDLRLRLANVLLVLRRTDEAVSHFQQLLKMVPNSAEVQTGWGRMLVVQGQSDQAREIFQQVLKTHPQDYDATLALGQLELNDNHLDEALALLQLAVAMQPNDAEVRNALAGALQRAGRAAEARMHFEYVAKAQEATLLIQALRAQVMVNTKDVEARYKIAELLRDASNQTDRLAWLRSIIEIDPRYQRAHAALAELYAKTGNRELAATHRAISEKLLRESTESEKPKP